MDIVLGNYKGLKANIPYIAYTEEDVNSQIATLLSGNPVREQKTGPLAMGDTAVIDYEGFKDGVAFEGGKAEKYPLGIGSGSFIPGFEEQLVGMEIGEDRDINLSFPEQYHAPELAGKAVVFKVKLHEIYNEKEAELNDEFAASLNFPEVQSVEDLKKYINEYLEYQVEARKADAAREKLYDQILESSSCLVSPQAVETAVNMQLQQMAASFAQQGVAMEQYLQMTGKTMDSLKDELKPVAQKQVLAHADIQHAPHLGAQLHVEGGIVADAVVFDAQPVQQIEGRRLLGQQLTIGTAVVINRGEIHSASPRFRSISPAR